MKVFYLLLLLLMPGWVAAQGVVTKNDTSTIYTSDIGIHSLAWADHQHLAVLGSATREGLSYTLLQQYNIKTGQKVWEKTLLRRFSSWPPQLNSVEYITQSRDKGFILLSQEYTKATNTSAGVLAKTDSAGNITWKTDFASGVRISESPDGSFFVSGTNFLRKVSAQGQVVWSKNVEFTINGISATKDKGCVLIGATPANPYADIAILKVDAHGNELWNKTVDYQKLKDIGHSVTEAENGDLLISGMVEEAATERSTSFMSRLNSVGEQLWFKLRPNGWYLQYATAVAGDQFVALSGSLLELDGEGNILSDRYIGGLGASKLVLKVTPLEMIVAGIGRGIRFWSTNSGKNPPSCNLTPSITANKSTILCPGESVILDAGEGYTAYRWNTGQTTRYLTVAQAGEYRVEVTDSQGCSFATNPIMVSVKQPFHDDKICFVTVDKDSGKNKIFWGKTPGKYTAAYHIYKDAVGGTVKIGVVPFDAAPSFVDFSSSPESKTERYLVRAVDSCGNESVQDAIHRTILLQVSLGPLGEVNLNWNKYEGASALKTIVYRGRDLQTLMPIAELAAHEDRYTDRNPVSEEKYYQIAVELSTSCAIDLSSGRIAQPLASTLTRSNTYHLQVNGTPDAAEVNKSPLTVWPNPIQQHADISLAHVSSPVRLELLNSTGQVVLAQVILNPQNIYFDRGRLPQGLYILTITLRDGSQYSKRVMLR